MTPTNPDDDLHPLLIRAKTMAATDICQLELVDPAGGDLPAFTAGAHLVVRTPSGAMRNYSLSNDPVETHRYVLGVKAERDGRGGSLSIVEGTAEGDTIEVSNPVNDFPLVPAPDYLLIAGGIGITPIIAMARELARTGQSFRLVYCTRGPEYTAFADDLAAPELAPHVTIHHDGGDPDRLFDFWDLLEKPGKAHVYCCGPRPLMEEIRGVTGHWPQSAIHFEDFATDVRAVQEDDRAFTVRHARTGEVVEIPADATILDTLRAKGHRVASSCESGTCGTCRTTLVSGEADHRDMVLTDDEKATNIMVCVSRAKSGDLVLDW